MLMSQNEMSFVAYWCHLMSQNRKSSILSSKVPKISFQQDLYVKTSRIYTKYANVSGLSLKTIRSIKKW